MASSEQAEVAGDLEKLLSGQRETREELERRGIIKQGGALASAMDNLERNLAKDRLHRKFNDRPDYEELVAADIAPNRSIAASLQAPAKSLERNLLAAKLHSNLQQRGQPEEIAKIMPADDVAPRLRSARIALENAFTRDHLKHLLDHRPSPNELIEHNILKATPAAAIAPGLQSSQAALEKQMLSDRLNNFLVQRPAAAVDVVAPSLQAAQRDLQRNLAKSQLYHALQHRPSPQALVNQGVLQGSPQQYYDVGLCEDGPAHAQLSMAHADANAPGPFDERARAFVLTRILFKHIADLGNEGRITMAQKGVLKDLVVDQDASILAAADVFDQDGDLDDLTDTLFRLVLHRS